MGSKPVLTSRQDRAKVEIVAKLGWAMAENIVGDPLWGGGCPWAWGWGFY